MTLTKEEAGTIINNARRKSGLKWAELAEKVRAPQAWLVSAVLGQHPMSADQAKEVVSAVGLTESYDGDIDDVIFALTGIAYRGLREIPSDPTIYRLWEAVSVYGPAVKELIYEEFGDGIMSAIDCGVAVEREPDPRGDRVKITFSGKYLKYDWPDSL